MSAEDQVATQSVAIARIDATLAAMMRQLDYSERNAAQMVRLAEDKLALRFDTIDKRLEQMDNARELARVAQEKRDEEIERRLTAVERFNTRLVGFGFGVSVVTGGLTAGILKAIGG